MTGIRKDLKGRQFGRWKVIRQDKTKTRSYSYWICRCECPLMTIRSVRGTPLLSGESTSCGCLKRSKIKKTLPLGKVPKYRTKLYKAWSEMKRRCENKNCTSWKYYGDKGIVVCDEWHDFEVFKAWSDFNGYDRGMTIDRIDSNGNYEPNNCEFVTRSENTNRMHRDKKRRIKGVTK